MMHIMVLLRGNLTCTTLVAIILSRMQNDSSIWGANYASFILLNVGAYFFSCYISYSMILGRASQ